MNSAVMEKEGLLRGLRYLARQELYVADLVADQHPSITKTIAEEFPNIRHWFDSWHVIKGMSLLFFIKFCSAALVLDAYDILAVFTQNYTSIISWGLVLSHFTNSKIEVYLE